jgi:hypothetical protein
MNATELSAVQVYGFCVLGILVSVVLPLLRKMLPGQSGVAGLESVWTAVKPYVVIGAFSLIVGVLIVAFGGDAVKKWSWQTAILAGYAWDSTLQKIAKP